MDPFCLELHSNKQDKRLILKKFEDVLKVGEIENSKDFNLLTANLNNLKDELKEVVNKIHYFKLYNYSLYEAILNYKKYSSFFSQLLQKKHSNNMEKK